MHIKHFCGRSALLVGTGCALVGFMAYFRYKRGRAAGTVAAAVRSAHSVEQLPADCSSSFLMNSLMLSQDTIHVADPRRVANIIHNIIAGGVSKLQIVADFDRTLTALTHDGVPVPSSHCVIENAPDLPAGFKDQTKQMLDYYLPIELNPKMSKGEKTPFMEEWWNRAHDLLIQCCINREHLSVAVQRSNLYLRDGASHLLETLHRHQIPLMIFSAGIGDVIQECLTQRYQMFDNIKIVSNWMDFDASGMLVGFKGQNIHIFNKNVHAIENSGYFESIKQRHNVILLGDSLGDLDIAEGISDSENMLTIGFLNYHVETSLAEYKQHFDIVLTETDSLDILLTLMDAVIGSSDT